MGYAHSMKRISFATMALLVTACGGPEPVANGRSPSDETATQVSVNTADDATGTTFEQPPVVLPGLKNPDAPPDVAMHVARQERCSHWRGEQQGGSALPDVTAGLERECRGIDAELTTLRERHSQDGAAIRALRGFSPVE